jgi:hypothetical protein
MSQPIAWIRATCAVTTTANPAVDADQSLVEFVACGVISAVKIAARVWDLFVLVVDVERSTVVAAVKPVAASKSSVHLAAANQADAPAVATYTTATTDRT